MLQLLMAIITAVSVMFGCGEGAGLSVSKGTEASSELETGESSIIQEIQDTDFGEETRSKSQVTDTMDAKKSKSVTTEKATIAAFSERGFKEISVTTTYDMDGNYYTDEVIEADSSEEHPLYSAYYISQYGYCWLIYYCNGEFSAWPASYVLSGQTGRDVLVSEHEYVMSYDSETGCFYKLIPDKEGCRIIEVTEINASALDKLAEGVLGV